MKTLKDLSVNECLDVLGKNHIGHLAYIYGKSPYIVPVTYYHDVENKCIISYSNEGHKMDAMRNYDTVAFQVEEIDSIQDWRSVMVLGKFEEIKGSTAKMYLHTFATGVQDVITKKGLDTPRYIKDFSSKLDERGMPIVYRIIVHDIIGKHSQ